MKLLLLTIIIVLFPIQSYAYETPYISGQDTFNDTVSQITEGSFSLSPENIIKKISELFLSEIKENSHFLVLFFIIGTISSIISLMEFSNNNTPNAAFFACYTLCSGIALSIFSNVVNYATSVISTLTDFITKFSPILISLLVASGKVASASAFHPILSTAVFFSTLIIEKCIIPLSIYSAVLSIANNLSDQIQISSFCRLVTSISKWILTAVFTIFTGICGIYGFAAPAIDVVSAKTAKFAVGSLVPVVGRFLSDTLDTVVSASTMMKNAVGGAGIITMFSIISIPVVKIIVMQLMLRICSALIEPLTDKKISKLLSDISDTIAVVFGMVLAVLVLFIICISIIIGSTN